MVRSALEMLGYTVSQQAEGPLLGYWAASMDNWTSITIESSQLDSAIESLRGLRADAAHIDWKVLEVGEPVDELARQVNVIERPMSRRARWRRFCRVGIKVMVFVMLAWLIVVIVAAIISGVLVLSDHGSPIPLN